MCRWPSRKKEQVSGIWMNRQAIIWQNAPSFYHIFSNRALDEVLSEQQQASLRIGADHIGLRTSGVMLDKEETKLWRNALTRNMTDRGLWQVNERMYPLFGAHYSVPLLICLPILFPVNMKCGFCMCRIIS